MPQSATVMMSEKIKTHQKKRIGIFGGTFNPPHLGQLLLAQSVAEQLGLDQVLWLPNATPSTATHVSAISPSHRAQMVKLATHRNDLFDIALNELYNGGVASTYETVSEIVSDHPENDYYFIMGSNLVKTLNQWDNIEQLSQLVTLVVGDWKNISQVSDYPMVWLSVPSINISANDIRSKIRMGQNIDYLVPEMVASYIQEYNLYRGFHG